jgi:precorrin-3B synthase
MIPRRRARFVWLCESDRPSFHACRQSRHNTAPVTFRFFTRLPVAPGDPLTEPLSARLSATPIRPSACPGLLRIVPAMDGGICRIKLPGGLITADQALAVAQAAERFAGGVIEATNRGNLQIRGIGTDHDGLIASLLDAGLGPGNPASDDVRNLMLSPTAGLDPQQLLDVRRLAGQILHTLEHHPRFHELSPKFALSLDGGEGLAMLEHPHDLWLSALCVDGQTLLGFGLAGCPANDSPLAAVAPEAAHALVVAVLETFLDLARPEHARMRDLLKEVPVARFMEHVAARFAQPLWVNQDITGWRRQPIRPLAHLGPYAQAQHGVVAIGAAVPLGRMRPSMLREAARLACAAVAEPDAAKRCDGTFICRDGWLEQSRPARGCECFIGQNDRVHRLCGLRKRFGRHQGRRIAPGRIAAKQRHPPDGAPVRLPAFVRRCAYSAGDAAGSLARSLRPLFSSCRRSRIRQSACT